MRFLLFLAFLVFEAFSTLSVTEDVNFFKLSTWDNIELSLNYGEIRGYYSLTELNSLMLSYLHTFPAVIGDIVNLGSTLQGEAMYAIQVTYDSATYSSFKTIVPIASYTNRFSSRPAVLFTAMHEGTDPNTMQLAVLLIKKMIFGFVNNDPAINYLLSNRQIWIIPCVNRDTYNLVAQKFLTTSSMDAILPLKNQFDDGSCSYPYKGVNLRFNYPSYNSATFTPRGKCDPYYEGPSQASEPETQNVIALLAKVSFKIAINFFGQSNSLFVPLTYLTNANYELTSNYIGANDYTIFHEIYLNAFPNKNPYFGNFFGKHFTAYMGEISDYLYKKKNILAMSVELGTSTISSTAYPFLSQSDNLAIMSNNFDLGLYTIFKSGIHMTLKTLYQLIESCQEAHEQYINCAGTGKLVFTGKYQIQNDGLVDAGTTSLTLIVPTALQITQVSVSTSYSTLYHFTDAGLSSVTVTTSNVASGVQYKFSGSTISQRQIKYISVAGLFTSGTSSTLNLNIENAYSYNNNQELQTSVVTIGSVEGFQDATVPVDLGPSPHKPSTILVIVYFAIMGFIGLTILGGHLLGFALKVKEKA